MKQSKTGIVWMAVILAFGAVLLVLIYLGNGRRASSGLQTQSNSPERNGLTKPPGAPDVRPVTYRPLTPQSAMEINDATPLEEVGPRAAPFRIDEGTLNWERANLCLAQAVYYEARNEPTAGQEAVAQVVLNRVRSPAFPASICGVVYQGSDRVTGCQFTFTCDGSLSRGPIGAAWQQAKKIAASALQGRVYAPVGNATHYHANYVVPYWASSMAKIRALGIQDFYRWPGRWRAAAYFSQNYANNEPVPGQGATATESDSSRIAPSHLPETLSSDQDSGKSPFVKGRALLAIDQSTETLKVDQSAPMLDPKLNLRIIPRADIQARISEPNRTTDLGPFNK